jgi:hypothetical protein
VRISIDHPSSLTLSLSAVKYTERGSVGVVCREIDEPGDAIFTDDSVVVEICVTDTGRGMSHNQLGSMFRQLEQVERINPTRDYNGQGVGKNNHCDFMLPCAHLCCRSWIGRRCPHRRRPGWAVSGQL